MCEPLTLVLGRVSNSIACLFFPNQMQQESTIPVSGQGSPGRLWATGTRPCLFSYLEELRNYINWRKHSMLFNPPVESGLQICQWVCWTIKVKQWWSKWKFNAALPRLHNVSWPMKHFPAVHTAFCQHWCKSPGGRDPGLPFKLMPRSFNLVRTTEGEKKEVKEKTRGSAEQTQNVFLSSMFPW